MYCPLLSRSLSVSYKIFLPRIFSEVGSVGSPVWVQVPEMDVRSDPLHPREPVNHSGSLVSGNTFMHDSFRLPSLSLLK